MTPRQKLLISLALFTGLQHALHAELLFSDSFDDVTRWTGKRGGDHSAEVVADPLRPKNSVVTFSRRTAAGDIFSPPIQVSPGNEYRLEFDYLGVPGAGVPGDLGGYIGISDDTTPPHGQHVWLDGTTKHGRAIASTLIDDGEWRTYQLAFDPFDPNQLALPSLSTPFNPTDNTIRIMIEDYDGSRGVAGDVFFDNVRLYSDINQDAVPATVDGIAFSKFVDINTPVGIGFDAHDNLYVGNGVGTKADQIRFIPADGSAVIRVGPELIDPDFVYVDIEGHVADKGDVLVGGAPLVAFGPASGKVSTVLGGNANVFEILIDERGDLFVGQYTGVAEVLKVSNDVTEQIISIPQAGSPRLTFESDDTLLVRTNEDYAIRRYDLNSLDTPTVLGVYRNLEGLGDIEVAANGNFSSSIFLSAKGGLYTIDAETGDADLFAGGFDLPIDVAFDRSGRMFVSDEGKHAIYTLCSPWLPGDATKDGEVEFVDFLSLAANFDNEASWDTGDFNCDGRNNFDDFLTLAKNFGVSLRDPISEVPEPGSTTLLVLALPMLRSLHRRRDRRSRLAAIL